MLDFGVGNAPVNFTMHDHRLSTQVSGDAVIITGLNSVNYDDVYFGFIYGGSAVSAFDIAITVCLLYTSDAADE